MSNSNIINRNQIQINLCQIRINLCQIRVNLCQIRIRLRFWVYIYVFFFHIIGMFQ